MTVTIGLEPGRTALLVIDMQRGFIDEGASLFVPGARALVPGIRRLIDAARIRTMPVIYTEFVYDPAIPCLRGDPFGIEHLPVRPGEPTGFGRPSSNCIPGAPGPESPDTIPELAPQAGELVIRGHTYDKFFGTPLDLALRSRDIRCLIVAGILADICVNATVLSASTRDYRVTVVRDGTTTLWPEILDACLRIWGRKFARIATIDEVLAEIAAWPA